MSLNNWRNIGDISLTHLVVMLFYFSSSELLYTLCIDDPTTEQREEFLHEIRQMKRLGAHPKIVSLVGCCTLQESMFLVIEYVPFGDLLQWLRQRRRSVGICFIKEY